MFPHADDPELEKSIAIIGSGPAGLISAHVLLNDGFKNVEVLTRDHSPGGTWAAERLPPDVKINKFVASSALSYSNTEVNLLSVHGEYRFSCLPMPTPEGSKKSGGRLTGEDIRLYMESFTDRFLKDRIQYDTVITNIHREDVENDETKGRGRWAVSVRNRNTGVEEVKRYHRIVLCTGVSSVSSALVDTI